MDNTKQSPIKLSGYVKKIIYRNEDTRYTVFSLSLDDGCVITAFSYDGVFELNNQYIVSGYYVSHATHGKQFKIISYVKDTIMSIQGVINYLSSDKFVGIGPKTAAKIVACLGATAIKRIEEDKNVLNNPALGISSKNKETIYNTISKSSIEDKIRVQLFNYDLTTLTINKIIKKYGSNAISVLENNPYKFIEDIENIGFIKADEIALKVGILPNSEYRICACIIYILKTALYDNGDSYMHYESICAFFNKLITNIEVDIKNYLDILVQKNKIVNEDDRYYDLEAYEAEKSIASKISKILGSITLDVNLELLEHHLELLEKADNIKYTKTQKEAVLSSICSNVSIITGGPGTGKTTIINLYVKLISFIYLNSNMPINIALCAPTGKASRRLGSVTGLKSKTIHSLLEFGQKGTFERNSTKPLDCNVLVIDEASMVDMFLFNSLLDALKNNTKILIVGDVDQLPSVGPGQVLFDLINSEVIKTTYLKEILRQNENSYIVKLAYDVNHMEVKNNYNDINNKDLKLLSCKEELIIPTIKQYIAGLTTKYNYSLIDDILVLIPQYKNTNGIDSVNTFLQKEFNHNTTNCIKKGFTKFYEGDKIIQTKNDNTSSVMNGDIGYIKEIYSNNLLSSSPDDDNNNKQSALISFENIELVYNTEDFENIDLAYAISIHKSQGSEQKVVLLPLSREYSYMLCKELIYTAITRAKEKLYIFGDLNMLKYASTKIGLKRKTTLKQRISEINR